MQQGYGGGVSEFPQFMVDASSLFSISSAPAPAAAPLAPPAQTLAGAVVASPSSLQPHFSHHFHSHIPFTQQLFQQHQHHTQSHHHHHQVHHHFQLFNPTPQQDHHERTRLMVHQQLGLDPESGPENSGGGGGGGPSPGRAQHATPSFLNAAMSFKLAVDTGTSCGGTAEDDVILSGGGGGNAGEEESAIKEPSWRPLDIDFISSSNKRCKDKESDAAPPSPTQPPAKYYKKGPEAGNGSNNYKLFSELEAIYKPGSGGGFADCGVAVGTSSGGGNRAGGSGGNGVDCTGPVMGNQTGAGSGSGLTGDENPLINEPMGLGDMSMVPTGTETSAGEEATPVKKASKSGGEGRRKRRRQRRLSSLAAFFERLVRQLVDHQEALHNRFLESMERREQERASREESWRLQEAAKAAREAAARAQERALASAREAAIVSFLEKITGETINLPTNPDFDGTGIGADAMANANNMLSTHVVDMSEHHDLGNASGGTGLGFSTSRWPKTEVQALIRVRSGLEARFQEPGLKGPLWEEVSMRMTALGYRRSAKRCKEKWENINKYFRKAKESGKKRPQHSKTCPYFHQLDQLYSKSSSYMYSPSSPSVNPTGDAEVAKGGGSELLDAVIVPLDQMGPSRDFDQEGMEGEDDEEDDERHEEREEGEGESHGHGQDVADQATNESSLFF